MKHYAKKKYGQNFLKDKNLLKRIVEKADVKNKHVIEIGPGQGALTAFLVLQATDVIAYEIDKSLKPLLDTLENEHSNLKIVYDDFLKIDLNQFNQPLHVVANVPYYITTPIIFKLLECDQIQSATLMIQKEVSDRLMAKPNTSQYNALSIVIQSQADLSKLMDVKRHLFYPVPNVDSVVIKISKKPQKWLNQPEINFVKACFTQKRKTIVNNLYEYYQVSKPEIILFLNQLGFEPNIRAEQIDILDFIKMARAWSYD